MIGRTERWRSLREDERGSSAVMFAISLPVLIAAGMFGLDYATAASERSRLQSVADATALATVREFQIAKADVAKLTAIAESYVKLQAGDNVKLTTQIDPEDFSVKVTLEKEVDRIVMVPESMTTPVRVSATARLTGGLPLCLLALDPAARGAIKLEKNARLSAPGCTVQSNSKSKDGLMSLQDAVLQAGFICSAGGRVKTKNANYTPEPLTDCPPIPDPLSSRQGPADLSCNYTNKVVDGVVLTLQPGVYCGGLTLINGAQVTLKEGIFVIKDGPLLVDSNAEMKGINVALYLKGAGANLTFAQTSVISLTAPKEGPLTGILIFDDPSGAPAPEKSGNHSKAGKSPREHSILSDNARTLLGTIYMPKGRLIVDSTKMIADRSAYTVMIVQQLDLYDGPNLVLNTDYGGSDIPVPKGVGPYGASATLTQ